MIVLLQLEAPSLLEHLPCAEQFWVRSKRNGVRVPHGGGFCLKGFKEPSFPGETHAGYVVLWLATAWEHPAKGEPSGQNSPKQNQSPALGSWDKRSV